MVKKDLKYEVCQRKQSVWLGRLGVMVCIRKIKSDGMCMR